MLHIVIESSFPLSANCAGNDIPGIDGNSYSFTVTDEEYMFWQGLEPAEQLEFTNSLSRRCFHEVLGELMRKKRPMNYADSSAAVGIDGDTILV